MTGSRALIHSFAQQAAGAPGAATNRSTLVMPKVSRLHPGEAEELAPAVQKWLA